MYAENGHIPKVKNHTIWRYMNFEKFLSLLSSQELYFCPATKFEDPFEGSFAVDNMNSFRLPQLGLNSKNEPFVLDAQRLFEMQREMNKKIRKTMHINCWHINTHESEAMWKLYLKGENGIVIQSTVDRLKKSIEASDILVQLGEVNYIDYEKDSIPEDNLWATFLHKRKSLVHENELRALVFKGYEPKDLTPEELSCTKVSVDLDILAEKIYVDPYSPALFDDQVKSVVHKYNFDFIIEKSKLCNQPLF